MPRFRRPALAGAVLVSGAALGLLAGAPASAQPVEVDQVTITGGDLSAPVVVEAADSPRTCLALYREISWLNGRTGQEEQPEVDLGPGYAMEVSIEGEPRHWYELYPVAEGGPRVYRPAEQPGGRTASEGWFYGRLSMPETLADAGVLVPGAHLRLGGGSGGGGEAPDPTPPPAARADGPLRLTTWLDGVLLTAAVAMVATSGLAAVAYLIRRKV